MYGFMCVCGDGVCLCVCMCQCGVHMTRKQQGNSGPDRSPIKSMKGSTSITPV